MASNKNLFKKTGGDFVRVFFKSIIVKHIKKRIIPIYQARKKRYRLGSFFFSISLL